MHTIQSKIPTFKRPSKEVIDALKDIGTATVAGFPPLTASLAKLIWIDDLDIETRYIHPLFGELTLKLRKIG